jgi:hypothetical protein
MMLPREQRAALVQESMARRNLSRNAAHQRLEISRPAMEKLWDGRDVEIEIIERFARGMGLDVNQWREHWGYERVESAADILFEGWERMCEEFPDREIPVPIPYRGVRTLTADEARSILADLRDKQARGLFPKKAGG